MNNINQERETGAAAGYETVGQQLHRAETAICIGRRAIKEIVYQDPIDTEALTRQREAIASARQQRNSLRQQLQIQKNQDNALPGYKWGRL